MNMTPVPPGVFEAVLKSLNKPPPEPKTGWAKFKDQPWCSYFLIVLIMLGAVGVVITLTLMAFKVIPNGKPDVVVEVEAATESIAHALSSPVIVASSTTAKTSASAFKSQAMFTGIASKSAISLLHVKGAITSAVPPTPTTFLKAIRTA